MPVAAEAPILYRALTMDIALPVPARVSLDVASDQTWAGRHRAAFADLVDGMRHWRLYWTLGWLDVRLRYRGSVLGPLWLTLSTAVMVAALGVLYSTLFVTNLHDYLPFLALSIVLWNALSGLVGDGCATFTGSEGMIRSIRMPYTLYVMRIIVRTVLTLAHNIVVVVAVDAIFDAWPGTHAMLAVPGLLIWMVDSVAICLLLGTFCARYRDIPPIVASVLQIGFFVSPLLWKPDQLHGRALQLLPLNPFFSLFEVVRGPLLGNAPSPTIWASAAIYSAILATLGWMLFARARSRLAFWV